MKLLNKELGALKEAAAQAAESLRGAEAANAGLEEQLQHSHQELRDLAASKDARCAATLPPRGWGLPPGPACSRPAGCGPVCFFC